MNGAVYIAKEADVTLIGTRFERNNASTSGGAIYAGDNSHIEVFSSIFTGRLQASNDEKSMLLMSMT